MMDEPVRLNLLNVLNKNLQIADRKTYLHRIVYIGNYETKSQQDTRFLQLVFESNVKLINESNDEPITGFTLFYTEYFISIIEGPEDLINKHLKILLESFDQNSNNEIPKVDLMKVLIISHHIIQRFYSSYNTRPARPPVLLEKIEPTNDTEEIRRHVKNCIMKLYRLSEYLKNQPPNLLRAAIDNISELCLNYLPEFILLDFLLTSQALIDLRKYVKIYGSVPEVKSYQEIIWPAPEDFVPYDVIGEDKSKQLIFASDEPVEQKEESEEEFLEI